MASRPSIESLSATVPCSSGGSSVTSEGGQTVVRLWGEHDISTVAELAETLARAIALDDADVVVDLADVQFVGAATLGVMVRARNFLRLHARRFTVRSAPTVVRRILEICGVTDLLDSSGLDATGVAGPAAALGTWVAVPAADWADPGPGALPPDPSRSPDPVPAERATAQSQFLRAATYEMAELSPAHRTPDRRL